jgi:hypothetical protein
MASYLLRNSPVPTSEKKFTFSTWLKLSSVSTAADNGIVEWYKTSSERHQILIDSSTRQLRCYSVEGGVVKINIYSNIALRDCNGWYHILIQSDNTLASSSDRFKLWVNGVAQTFSSYSWTFPQNSNINVFDGSGTRLNLGTRGEAYATWLNGILADTYYIDGSIIAHTQFGETDATTGIWKPKTEPTIASFGNAGVHLKYENSGNIGLDSSGLGNNFSTSGTITQTVDTPSNVFATWNPLENYYQSATLSNGNTTIQTGNSQYSPSSSTLGVSSGKWYWEVEYDALSSGSDVAYVGVLSQFATNSTTSLGTNANDYGYYVNGNYYNNNTGTAYGTTYTTGDIIGVALDLDNNKLYFSKNGTWQNSGDPESGATGTGAISITNPTSTTNGAYFPSICDGSSSANATFKTNFGNGYFGTTAVASAGSNGNGAIFEFDCPSGYYALNTKNINTYG